MAVSKSISAVGSHGYHTFTMTVTETAVNTSANTSTCTVKFTIKPKATGYNWEDYTSHPPSGTVYFAGNSWSWSLPDYDGKSVVTLVSKTVTVAHDSDGSKTITGTSSNSQFRFTCSSLSDYYLPGSASNYGSITLTKIDRYPTVTVSNTSKTETSITMKWTSDLTCNRVRYRVSADSGSTWGSWASKTVNAKTGSYTVSGLSANTTYTVQTELRSSASGLTATANKSVKTYNWPYATINNFNLKDGTTITITNPLNRECFLEVFAEGTSVERWDGAYTDELEQYAINDMLGLIPNSMTGSWYATVTYDGHVTTTATKTFSATGYNPTITSATYADTNATAQAIIQDASKILQNVSTPRFTIAGTALYNATIASASVTIMGVEATGTASGGTATVNCGTINSGSNVTATVTLTDSRGNSATQTVTVTMLGYTLPTAAITLARKNNFYSDTDITVDATVLATGSNTPTITVSWRESGASTWAGSQVVQNNTLTAINSPNGLDNTKAWDVQVVIVDSFGGSTTYTYVVAVGMPIVFFDRFLRSMGINCFPTDTEQLRVDNVDILGELFYKAGDTFTITGMLINGFVTSSTKSIFMSFHVEKSMANITNVTISEGKGSIRCAGGGYLNSKSSATYDWLNETGLTWTVTKQSDHVVRVRIDSTSAFTGISNNDLLVFYTNPLTVEFS